MKPFLSMTALCALTALPFMANAASEVKVAPVAYSKTTLSKDEAKAATRTAAQKAGIPVDIFLRLVRQESGFNQKALSVKGAYGLAQLMPATAAALGVDRYNPYDNLAGGARYLKKQYNRFGNWKLALAAYNAGPGVVTKYGGVPPYPETQNYVARILGTTSNITPYKLKALDISSSYSSSQSVDVFSKSNSRKSQAIVFD